MHLAVLPTEEEFERIKNMVAEARVGFHICFGVLYYLSSPGRHFSPFSWNRLDCAGQKIWSDQVDADVKTLVEQIGKDYNCQSVVECHFPEFYYRPPKYHRYVRLAKKSTGARQKRYYKKANRVRRKAL